MTEVRRRPNILPKDQRRVVRTSVVRAWAREVDKATGQPRFVVGQRGHIPKAVYEEYDRVHRTTRSQDRNPWTGHS